MEIGEGSSSNGDPGEIARKIRAVVDGKKVSSNIYKTQCCIFKVPKLIRKGMEEAYTPMVVSIGPYHRTDERLQSMEHFKLQYLWHFLEGESMPIPGLPKRVEGESISDLSSELKQDPHLLLMSCVEKILEKEDEIRGSYADPISLSGDDFVQMVLLDSVFIIWCLDNLSMLFPSAADDNRGSVFDRVKLAEEEIIRDLLLLENQLPLFIIHEIFNIRYPGIEDIPFTQVLGHFIRIGLPLDWVPSGNLLALMRNKFIGSCQNEEPKKTIDIMSPTASIPPHISYPATQGTNVVGKFLVNWVSSGNLLALMRNRFTGSCQNEEPKETVDIMSPTASHLHAAGVKFKLDKKPDSLLKIEFDKHQGVLTIPKLYCNDLSQYFFRNAMAFEQRMYLFKKPAYITHYCYFLDCLINTKEDVQLLADKGIVDNCMGSDVVCDMFNTISNNTWIVADNYSYTTLSKELNDHCKKKWNKWMATLKNKYFAHPWAFISVIYAIVLLLLTIAQVILAILALP